jgi:transposase-like protein
MSVQDIISMLELSRKKKEALVIALFEKGRTYREITKEAGVSPNTIKAILNKAGLDQTTSISSRAFELYSLRALYYNTSSTLSIEYLLSQSSINQNEQHPNQFGYNEDTREKLLLDEAKQLYNRIVAVLTGKCMNEIDIDTESVAHMSQLPDILSNPSTCIIPDVSEGEISIDRKDSNDINLADELIVMDGVLIPRPKYDDQSSK